MNLDIIIPSLPPGINATYKTGKGHFYKAKVATDWSEKASIFIRNASSLANWEHIEGSLYEVNITFTNKRLDVDAPLKLILDTLSRSLGFDDKIIQKTCIEKTSGEPQVKIELRDYAIRSI